MSATDTKTSAPNLVSITDKALDEIRKLLSTEASDIEQNELQKGLRLGVQGGGCSGMSYKLSFDIPQEKDYVLSHDDVKVYIDPKSAIYLKGIVVDYQGGLEGKGFVFMNPNAASTCGCGESFSV